MPAAPVTLPADPVAATRRKLARLLAVGAMRAAAGRAASVVVVVEGGLEDGVERYADASGHEQADDDLSNVGLSSGSAAERPQ